MPNRTDTEMTTFIKMPSVSQTIVEARKRLVMRSSVE